MAECLEEAVVLCRVSDPFITFQIATIAAALYHERMREQRLPRGSFQMTEEQAEAIRNMGHDG